MNSYNSMDTWLVSTDQKQGEGKRRTRMSKWHVVRQTGKVNVCRMVENSMKWVLREGENAGWLESSTSLLRQTLQWITNMPYANVIRWWLWTDTRVASSLAPMLPIPIQLIKRTKKKIERNGCACTLSLFASLLGQKKNTNITQTQIKN